MDYYARFQTLLPLPYQLTPHVTLATSGPESMALTERGPAKRGGSGGNTSPDSPYSDR